MTHFLRAKHFRPPVSPPPFMAGIAEVEIDKETGVVEMVDYAAVVDCGTVVNPSLARVQTEGGIAQGIGMALFEDIVYSPKGKNYSNSFMQYKIPSRLDVGNIRVEFESSYEPTGPFGAKSIGEIVINTPSPAIANAIQNAVGVTIRELPMTAEKVYRGMAEEGVIPLLIFCERYRNGCTILPLLFMILLTESAGLSVKNVYANLKEIN